MEKYFKNRVLKIQYVDVEKKQIDIRKLYLEKTLGFLADVSVTPLKTIDDLDAKEADLLIITASHVPVVDFQKWLLSMSKNMEKQGRIWVPGLIFASLTLEDLETIMQNVVYHNWYYDILAPEHMDSLPVRVANLVRIHDHLRELERYDLELKALDGKLKSIQAKVGLS